MQRGKQINRIPFPPIFRLIDLVSRLRGRFSSFRKSLRTFLDGTRFFESPAAPSIDSQMGTPAILIEPPSGGCGSSAEQMKAEATLHQVYNHVIAELL